MLQLHLKKIKVITFRVLEHLICTPTSHRHTKNQASIVYVGLNLCNSFGITVTSVRDTYDRRVSYGWHLMPLALVIVPLSKKWNWREHKSCFQLGLWMFLLSFDCGLKTAINFEETSKLEIWTLFQFNCMNYAVYLQYFMWRRQVTFLFLFFKKRHKEKKAKKNNNFEFVGVKKKQRNKIGLATSKFYNTLKKKWSTFFMRGITVIIVQSGLGYLSSNLECGYLHFP